MTKKYYINYIKKKEKYVDCEDLLSKYSNNSNYSFFIIKYCTNLLS